MANDVTAEGAGFDHDTNVVTLFTRDGREMPLPRMSKLEVAQRIFDQVLELRPAHSVTAAARGSLSGMAQDPARPSFAPCFRKTRIWLRYYDDLGIRLFLSRPPGECGDDRAIGNSQPQRGDHHGKTNFCVSARQIASYACEAPGASDRCPARGGGRAWPFAV